MRRYQWSTSRLPQSRGLGGDFIRHWLRLKVVRSTIGGRQSTHWTNSTLRGTCKGQDGRFSYSRTKSALSKGRPFRELLTTALQVVPMDTQVGPSAAGAAEGESGGSGTSVRLLSECRAGGYRQLGGRNVASGAARVRSGHGRGLFFLSAASKGRERQAFHMKDSTLSPGRDHDARFEQATVVRLAGRLWQRQGNGDG